jgi:SAM-dependent methyltransferase
MSDSRTLQASSALLGDTPERDYSSKLTRFNVFAEPELQQAIASLRLQPGMRVLDAGCGTGEALHWLWEAVRPTGEVVGLELSKAHAANALARAPAGTAVLQTDLLEAPLPPSYFDQVWCVNTINHLRDPLGGIRKLISHLKPDGRLALGQSGLLPDMYFAWDQRLERLTNEAVRRYYRDRYEVDERGLAAIRSIFGLLRRAELRNVTVKTFVIERVAPLDDAAEAYLLQTLFRDTWGERLRPYMDADDYAQLIRLCNPNMPEFALRRPDFHFVQTFTLATGCV